MESKFLSIVIPYYKESPPEVFPLLSSLNNQAGADFSQVEVLLVNDGAGNTFDVSYLDLFGALDIRTILMEENRGPGVARQVGLDHARGEYVMFCDADDVIHSVGVIGAFVAELKAAAPDILTSPWLEELKTEAGLIYITHEDEATWMHGKAFRTAYLREYGIRFHDELRVHEDSYFLSIAFDLTDNRRKLPVTSYVWKWGEGSITRKDGSVYTYQSVPTFHRALALSFGELERRGLTPSLVHRVAQLVFYSYFTLHQDHWLTAENAAYRCEAERSLVEELAPFLQYWQQAPLDLMRGLYNQERAKHFADGMETELFSDWAQRIGLVAPVGSKTPDLRPIV